MSEYDVVIQGGTIVDGTGFPRYRADVGIRGGKIAKIGRIEGSAGREVIDATGCIVAPGFIDLHTHYDAQVFWDPYCTSSGWHGFTTVAVGNCGFGFAPCKPDMRDRYMRMMENTEQIPYEAQRAGLPWNWETFPQFMESLRATPKGVNLQVYLPMNPLLIYVMGVEAAKTRPATTAERAEMRRLLNEAMDAGACGFSFSRLGPGNTHVDYDGSPMPSDTMAEEEALNLAQVLRERDQGYIQALCGLGGTDVSARDLVERLAEASQRPVLYNIVHVIDGSPDYHRGALKWLERLAQSGLRVFGQSAVVRTWVEMTMREQNIWDNVPVFNRFTQASEAQKIQMLKDPNVRREIHVATNHPELMWQGGGSLGNWFLKDAVGNATWKPMEGLSLPAIASARSEDISDTFCNILLDTNLDAQFRSAAAVSSDVELMCEVLEHPLILAGLSDGGAHTKITNGGGYSTDLIGWLVRDVNRISLEDMHRYLSYQPARIAGLKDRGAILTGLAADIVVYNLEELAHSLWNYQIRRDMPGHEWRRVDLAIGYKSIVVNGKVTFSNGESTGLTPGMLL